MVFYSVEDFLVFFTIFSVVARKLDVWILGICIMPDHIHVSIGCRYRWDVSDFVQEYTSRFSKEFNKDSERKGPLFKKAFGSATKQGDKSIRTNFSYVYNNGREKKLCDRTDRYQWNFMAYAQSDHPFSEKLQMNRLSRRMKYAIKTIDALYEDDQPLKYDTLRKIFRGVSPREKKQITDYIITKYNCIDYDTLISFYGTYDNMLLAFESNQGSEYDIKEIYEGKSDVAYRDITLALLNIHKFKRAKDAIALPTDVKVNLKQDLLYETPATPRQIEKYLHLQRITNDG